MEILKSCAAWGDWHPQVPRGMVVIAAESGDRVRAFVVPRAEYSKGMRFDPAKFREMPGFDRVQASQAHPAVSNRGPAQPAPKTFRDYGWKTIIAQLNDVEKAGQPENRPGSEPARAGSARPWKQVVGMVEGRRP